ncbi:neutral/alkaline non-lysosomal ceramidase N-terminal domain-containing protein [Larkinella ripae]
MKKTFFPLILIILTVSAHAQQFRAGAAMRVITPNPLLPISGGIGTPKKATEKKGDLFIRALVLEKGKNRIAIVSVDNLGWPSVLGNKSRALIKSIPGENVLIGATHTHSGPDAYGFPDQSGKALADLPYLDSCVKQLAEAVEEAVTKLQPAQLKVAVGEAKGKIAFNYYADDLYDPRCGVIQALSTAGKPIATLVNYAIHPEVIGSGRGILSPDLCGPLYDKIESKTGGMALFMNGAQGGMVTADVRREGGTEANTWEECIRIGELLGEEALRIVGAAPVLQNPSIFCATRQVEFPIESDQMKYIIKKSPLGYQVSGTDRVKAQVNLLNIGPAQVLTIPGEALPNIGYYVKRHMNTQFPFLFGLTNDAFGYMLTKVDFNSFKRYEYISRTSLGEMTGEIYIDQALKLVAESPKPEP